MSTKTTLLVYPHLADIWVPSQPVAGDLSVGDVAYAQLETATPCYLEPMTPTERLTILGRLDVRAHHLWLPLAYAIPAALGGITSGPLPAGTIFYRPAYAEAWLLIEPLDGFDATPSTAHAEGRVRHLAQLPPGIA